VAGSTAYFLISNFGVWLGSGCAGQILYPHTWRGLANCYLAAVPYYPNSLISTVVVAGLLFGVSELIPRRLPLGHVSSVGTRNSTDEGAAALMR
jgi:hypothetical protein